MYRTEQIKKNFVANDLNFDLATILNSLNFGDIQIINEVLMYRYDEGASSKGFFNYKKSLRLNIFQALLHYIPFTKWLSKILESKNF